MDLLTKLERTISGWFKGVPHLPTVAVKWISDNVWWIALIGAILSAIGVVTGLIATITAATLIGAVSSTYYVVAASPYTPLVVIAGFIALLFTVIDAILLGTAVTPLKAKQKKGWVLLFAVWLVGAVSVVVNAILSFNPFSFIVGILFGAIWLAISGYFLFEIHGQFAHTEKSKGVKSAKK